MSHSESSWAYNGQASYDQSMYPNEGSLDQTYTNQQYNGWPENQTTSQTYQPRGSGLKRTTNNLNQHSNNNFSNNNNAYHSNPNLNGINTNNLGSNYLRNSAQSLPSNNSYHSTSNPNLTINTSNLGTNNFRSSGVTTPTNIPSRRTLLFIEIDFPLFFLDFSF